MDDLRLHMNEERNSDLGVKDLLKLKKRLFDPEFRIIEARLLSMLTDSNEAMKAEIYEYKQTVGQTLSERLAFIESFTQSIEGFEKEMRERKRESEMAAKV